MRNVVTVQRPDSAGPATQPGRGPGVALLTSPVTAVAAIWLSAALVAVLAPDMVTGSEHGHLPIAAMTIWLWTLAATGYVLLAARRGSSLELTLGTATVWLMVFLVAVFAPTMVTGADPTEIPIAALVAPPVGTLATGYLALHDAFARVADRVADRSLAGR